MFLNNTFYLTVSNSNFYCPTRMISGQCGFPSKHWHKCGYIPFPLTQAPYNESAEWLPYYCSFLLQGIFLTQGSSQPRNQTQVSYIYLSRVRLFATPWSAAHQASLSITNFWSLLKLISIESVMPFNHLFLCHPLLLLPSIFPSIRVFQWVSSLHHVAKVLELQLQHQSFHWMFRVVELHFRFHV